MKEKPEKVENIICPFCGEEDFDLIGLKYHLRFYCEEYFNTNKIKNAEE